MAERYGPTGLGLAPLPKEDIPTVGKKIGRKKATHISGWCVSGFHEGSPKKSSVGSVSVECRFAHHCTCTCHDEEKMLRTLARLPEPEFPIPGAPPPARVLDGGGVSIRVGTIEAARLEEMSDEPSDTAKEGLEWRTYEFLKPFVVAGFHEEDVLTVGFIVAGLQKKGFSHSSGAVDAVLKRWDQRGFATVEKKPTRFKGFTEAGEKLGLVKFKALNR